MTALWASGIGLGDGGGNGFGDGFGHGWGNGDGRGNEYGDGYGNNRGGGSGNDWDNSNGDNWSRGNDNSDEPHGYPEQTYDGCTAISRLLACEATLPVTDLLALAVTR